LDILVLAAHPDDEVLGMGGTIKKLVKQQNKIHLCVVSEGASAQYDDKKMIKIRKEACLKSGKILGISTYTFLNFQDMKLDSIPQLEINIELEKIIKKLKPKVVYTTPSNDLNKDHQKVFESTLVVSRAHGNSVKEVLSYEIPAIIKFAFTPTVYEDIHKEFPTKIKAFKQYKTEIMKFPHPRSIEAIETLSKFRGMESGLIRAEGFQLIKKIQS
jgi:LmbE family N-acetylglucosaminyl deacetylase